MSTNDSSMIRMPMGANKSFKSAMGNVEVGNQESAAYSSTTGRG